MSSSVVDRRLPRKARFLSVLGLRIRVIEAGQGRPILLVHGGVGSAEHWRNLMDVLARRGFRAIAFDLPGFGLSTAPADVAYFGERSPFYPRLVQELVKRLAVEPVVLIGHSLGGTIAAVTAVCFPQLVERLVLISPGGVGDRLGPLMRVGAVPLAAWLLRQVPALLFRYIVSGAFYDGRKVPASLRRRWCQHFRHGPGLEMSRVLAQLASLRGPREDVRRRWARRLCEIRCPTLVVWGRQDRTTPLSQSQVLAALPDAETCCLERTRHFPLLEHPAELTRVLLRFLCGKRAIASTLASTPRDGSGTPSAFRPDPIAITSGRS